MAQLEHIEAIEKRLWGAADTLRANSNYASNEYFMPVMGLVFLRHAYSRYLAVKDAIEAGLPSRGGKRRAMTKEDFSQKSAIFLRPEAQFDYLVSLPGSADRAKAIMKAMELIEGDYKNLSGVLPKGEYQELDNDVLGLLLSKLNPDELKKVSGDVFGRIYEYFLTQFADQKAHDGGEFFTPVSLVSLIAHVGLDGVYVEQFMGQFGGKYRVALKALVTSFLDPKKADVRAFMTRMLHAQFCVQASGVTEEVLEKLQVHTGKPLKFRLFVDTNFLFSLLGLHENPSNASARELKDLLAKLKTNPEVSLFITPRTVSEAKHAIAAAKAQVVAIPASRNFTDAAIRANMSGKRPIQSRHFLFIQVLLEAYECLSDALYVPQALYKPQ